MVRVVVDSGCQAPAALVDRLGLTVVPLTVVVDGVAHLEGVDLDADGITAALMRGAAVSTSACSPGQLLAAYSTGGPVLAVHTGGVSSTPAAARLAASMAPVDVEVVDTGTASFPVALCAWAAVDVLRSGGSLAEASAAATGAAAEVGNVFLVGTLSLARRGGRLAAEVAPSDLPVVALVDSAMRPVAQAADDVDAVREMTAYVVAAAAGRRLRLGVGHLGAGDLADELEAALRSEVEVEQLVRYVVGPSIAVHSGVGTVGCVFLPV